MAKYRMEEMNDLNGKGERRLYPRLEIQSQVNLDELAKWISQGTTFSAGDIIGVVNALKERIAHFLAEGHSVKINGLGNFTASLKLRDGLEAEVAEEKGTKHNARSIEIRSINFRPEKQFIREVDGLFRPKRSEQKNRRSSTVYTPEERLSLALDFLATAPYLTVADYCRLTGLLKATACQELRLWANTVGSGIAASGLGTHRVYVCSNKA